jgi:hypothetical protein
VNGIVEPTLKISQVGDRRCTANHGRRRHVRQGAAWCEDEIGYVNRMIELAEKVEAWLSMPRLEATPYSSQELQGFASAILLIDSLNSFQQSGSWRGPTTRALVDALEDAVPQAPAAREPIGPELRPRKARYISSTAGEAWHR